MRDVKSRVAQLHPRDYQLSHRGSSGLTGTTDCHQGCQEMGRGEMGGKREGEMRREIIKKNIWRKNIFYF